MSRKEILRKRKGEKRKEAITEKDHKRNEKREKAKRNEKREQRKKERK